MIVFNKNDTVYLKSGIYTDKSIIGKVIEPGPEASLVRWSQGNVTGVSNKWIEAIPVDGGEGPGQSPLAANLKSSPSKAKAELSERAPVEKPKRPKVDDDLVLDIKSRIGMDEARLKSFAEANGVWKERYSLLPNIGLVRMTVVNRLRARVKKGHIVVWL